jgi:hypothetical protein
VAKSRIIQAMAIKNHFSTFCQVTFSLPFFFLLNCPFLDLKILATDNAVFRPDTKKAYEIRIIEIAALSAPLRR